MARASSSRKVAQAAYHGHVDSPERNIIRKIGFVVILLGVSLFIGTMIWSAFQYDWNGEPTTIDDHFERVTIDGVECLVAKNPSKANPYVSSCNWPKQSP